MAKHKPMCLVASLLLIVGAINWGLVGIGGFVGANLNVVNLILGSLPQVEWVVYILVGLSGLGKLGFMMKQKKCEACESMGKKEEA